MSFTAQEIEEFKIESLDLLDHAEKSLLSVGSEIEFSKIFDSIFRCFHNLKGAAGMMEMGVLQHHVHELETILMQFKMESTIPSNFVQLFLKGIDAAKSILDGHTVSFSYIPAESAVEVTAAVGQEVSKNTVEVPEQKDKSHQGMPAVALAEFKAECEETIDRIADILNHFLKEQFSISELESLYRDVHSLKGAAFLFSYNEIGNLAHIMESTLEPFRESSLCPTREVLDLLFEKLSCIDKHIPLIGQEVSTAYPAADLSIANNESRIEINMNKNETPESIIESKAVQSKETEANSSIRVAVSLLDNLMILMGEMVLVRNQVLQFSSQSEDLEFLNLSKRLNMVTSEIQGEMMKTRMQPIGNILSKYTRVIHDLSSELKKEISLNIYGAETELDKSLLESIKDPLTHIIRNSCDHGIETPDVRLKSGKAKSGSIIIKAYHEGRQVVIEVIDDGKGLHRDALTKKAVEKGIISASQVATMTEKEVFNLIFAPGFSTAASITNVSGRGVGMDVVRTNVERIGGTVELESVAGKGTVTKLRIPLTLAIVPALLVKSCGETFAIPQIKLEELVRVENNSDSNKIEFLHGMPVYRLRGQILPLVNLNKILTHSNDLEAFKTAINIAVLNADKCSFGLIVDEILDTADIVVKPINRLLKTLQLYSGATILGDGSIALILDVAGIAKLVQIAREKNQLKTSGSVNSSEKSGMQHELQEFLIVKLNSPTKHAIALNDVHRLEEFPVKKIEYSKKTRVIRYGKYLLPIISVNSSLEYGISTNSNKDIVSVVVIEKGGRLYGLEVDEIVDTISTDNLVDSSLANQNGTFGNINLADELIVVIDAFNIINSSFPDSTIAPVLSAARRSVNSNKVGKHLKILVVEDSVFFRREIAKILSGAGHDTDIAVDGMEALQLLEKEPQKFDLIVTDIEMPRMNGFELAKAIRSHQALKLLPMVAISSKADKKYTDKGISVGFDIYIEKLKSDTLLQAVSDLSNARTAA